MTTFNLTPEQLAEINARVKNHYERNPRPKYATFMLNNIIYEVPQQCSGLNWLGEPMFNCGISGFWTYHLTLDEYFNIVYYGTLIKEEK